jgi:hypothetical protein
MRPLNTRRIIVEWLSTDVGVDLHAVQLQHGHRALQLAAGEVGLVHRQRRDGSGEPIRVCGDEAGELVVQDGRELAACFRRDDFGRRSGAADDLLIAGKLVHHPEALVEIDEHAVVQRDGLAVQREMGRAMRRERRRGRARPAGTLVRGRKNMAERVDGPVLCDDVSDRWM